MYIGVYLPRPSCLRAIDVVLSLKFGCHLDLSPIFYFNWFCVAWSNNIFLLLKWLILILAVILCCVSTRSCCKTKGSSVFSSERTWCCHLYLYTLSGLCLVTVQINTCIVCDWFSSFQNIFCRVDMHWRIPLSLLSIPRWICHCLSYSLERAKCRS
jgi:hypothetical protein